MKQTTNSHVISWPSNRTDEVVETLVDAFHDYPVMRHVIGDAGEDYDRRLNLLIGFFVAGRVLRGHPILGIEDGGRAVAAATLTPAGELKEPPELPSLRESLWQALGAAARVRMESLIALWERLTTPGPQYHLNMLGVRRSHAGQGLGRRLLDAVHEISSRDPLSTGVSLSTEDPKNVPLYEHCGYRVTNYERASDDLETWILFRPDGSSDRKET